MKKITFTRELLEFINQIGVFLPRLETKYAYMRRLRKATYYGTFRRLEKNSYIQKKVVNNQPAYVITKLGLELLNQKLLPKRRKDGFSTIVIFDIPETKRKARNALRFYLREHGFRVLQKSVYFSNNLVPKNLLDLVKELDLHSHVSVIGGNIEYYL